MQVTETLNAGLKREYKVVVSAADLARELDARLKDMAGRANIKGFRPGKVPVPHLKRIYGKALMGEVVQKAVDDQAKSILADKGLKPAYQPEISLPQDEAEVNAIMDGKGDLSFAMALEVLPQFDVKPYDAMTLTRHVVEVSDDEVKEGLDRLSGQYKDWEAKKEGAKAAQGDRVTISFVGKVDDKAFDGGTAEDVPLELGSNQFIPGFEDQIVGAHVGDEREVKVSFPAEYGVAELAGKPAVFTVKVKGIDAPKTTDMNDDFAKKLGFEDLAKLKAFLKDRLGDELKNMTGMKLKRDVLDIMDQDYDFGLPEKLVDAEFNGIWNALLHEMGKAGRSFADEDTSEDEAKKEYRAIAERRVRLGLVLGTIGEKEGVQVSDQELQNALMGRARQFPGQEKQVFDYYRKNPGALIELRGPIFEQKVVDLLVSKATVTEKAVSREELQAMVQEDDEDEAAEKPKKKAAKKKKED